MNNKISINGRIYEAVDKGSNFIYLLTDSAGYDISNGVDSLSILDPSYANYDIGILRKLFPGKTRKDFISTPTKILEARSRTDEYSALFLYGVTKDELPGWLNPVLRYCRKRKVIRNRLINDRIVVYYDPDYIDPEIL